LDLGTYRDLGNGLFFALDDDWASRGGSPFGYVADALSATPDVHFGPKAWNGGIGPTSGKVLIVVGELQDKTKEASPFPGPIYVTEAGRSAGLGSL